MRTVVFRSGVMSEHRPAPKVEPGFSYGKYGPIFRVLLGLNPAFPIPTAEGTPSCHGTDGTLVATILWLSKVM